MTQLLRETQEDGDTQTYSYLTHNYDALGWQYDVAVTRWSCSPQLLYIEPGYYWDG